MKKILAVSCFCLLVFAACKGDKTYGGVNGLLLQQPAALGTSAEYTITGKIECPSCKVDSPVKIHVEDEDGNDVTICYDSLSHCAWERDFEGGDFQAKAALVPGTKGLIIIQVGGVNNAGYEKEFDATKDSTAISLDGIKID